MGSRCCYLGNNYKFSPGCEGGYLPRSGKCTINNKTGILFFCVKSTIEDSIGTCREPLISDRAKFENLQRQEDLINDLLRHKNSIVANNLLYVEFSSLDSFYSFINGNSNAHKLEIGAESNPVLNGHNSTFIDLTERGLNNTRKYFGASPEKPRYLLSEASYVMERDIPKQSQDIVVGMGINLVAPDLKPFSEGWNSQMSKFFSNLNHILRPSGKFVYLADIDGVEREKMIQIAKQGGFKIALVKVPVKTGWDNPVEERQGFIFEKVE